MSLLGRLYSRRIVNVNVNVVAAGVLALIPVGIVVYIATEMMGLENRLGISALTFFADVFSDVVIYYILHWLANHGPWRRPAHQLEFGAQPSFFKEATYVQFQRAAISPVLYTIALVLQHALIRYHWKPVWATVIGLSGGIVAARVLHTLWMLLDLRRGHPSGPRYFRESKRSRGTPPPPVAPAQPHSAARDAAAAAQRRVG